MSLFDSITTGAALPEQYLGVAILVAIIGYGIVTTYRNAVRNYRSAKTEE